MARKCKINMHFTSLVNADFWRLRFCVDSEGEDVAVHTEGSETEEDHDHEGEEGHDHENEEEHATDSASETKHCHFHAGVE